MWWAVIDQEGPVEYLQLGVGQLRDWIACMDSNTSLPRGVTTTHFQIHYSASSLERPTFPF